MLRQTTRNERNAARTLSAKIKRISGKDNPRGNSACKAQLLRCRTPTGDLGVKRGLRAEFTNNSEEASLQHTKGA